MIDLTTLPAPSVVEALSFEAILATAKADFAERLRPHLPTIDDILQLESEPVVKLLESHAYRELLYRARVNDAALAHLLAFATGADLDHKGAFYGVARLDGESDDRYRRRIQLRVRAMAGNGTREHYELAALTASQLVRDAIATQPQAGRVSVLLWLVDGADPDATAATVLAALNADDARPLGVPVSVALAQPKAIHITATLTRDADAPVDLVAQVQTALAPALADFARLGRAVSRSWITTRLHVAGISSVRYTDAAAPAEITPIAAAEYPVLGTVLLTDGGVA